MRMTDEQFNELIRGLDVANERLKRMARINKNDGWDFDAIESFKKEQEKGPKSKLVFRATPKSIFEESFVSDERLKELRQKERQLEEIKVLVKDISEAPKKIDRLKLTLELFALCGVINE